MGELLDGLGVAGLTLPGVILLFFLLVFFGKLIPRSTFEDFKAQMNERLSEAREDAEEWKKAYQLSEAARVEQAAVLPVILEMGKTQTHLLQSIHERADEKQ